MGEKKGKNDGGAVTVVLKVDMHCDECAKKLRRVVLGFEGVESVSADNDNCKLSVVGKIDPGKLLEKVEQKIHKKVMLISPVEAPKEKKSEDKKVEEKPKEPVQSTMVLKMPLHCNGCIERIRKTVSKIKGVEEVAINAQIEHICVKGTMDTATLIAHLQKKFKRIVEVIPPPKKVEGGGKKEEKNGAAGEGSGGDKKGGENKKGKGIDSGTEKKKDGDKKKDGGQEKDIKVDLNKVEYHGGGGPATHYHSPGSSTRFVASVSNVPVQYHSNNSVEMQYPMQYYSNVAAPTPMQYRNEDGEDTVRGGYMTYGYQGGLGHAPQLFSDENPNSCSLM